MENRVEKLFSLVKEYGYYTRKNDLDGLAQWNRLKNILLKSKIEGEWDQKVKQYFVEMRSDLKIQECENEIPIKNDLERKKMWEKHHFYLQHARIPTLNFKEPKLVRLLQIAYNAGQLQALWNDPFYTQLYKTYYENNKLDRNYHATQFYRH